jgi:hypothetical protein
MFSLVCSSNGPSDSPSGGRQTVPRTVSRTDLREDPRTSPWAEDRTDDLSTALHTYGFNYPAGLLRLELVPTGTQTTFRLYELFRVSERRKPDNAWHVYDS